ncbi:MAG: RHS repeat-associated core domain-containing protein [Patescibacteria group bacterium]
MTTVTGTIAELTDYYPYGGIRIDEQTNGLNEPKKFTGHEYDMDTGLNYMGARYQDGSRCQLLSQDPAFLAVGDSDQIRRYTKMDLQSYLSNPQHMNSYSYALNNPLNYVDEAGEFAAKTFGVGALQVGKTVLDGLAAVPQAIFAGGALAVGQPQAAALLTAGSLGNLDSAFADSSNAAENIVGSFMDREPSRSNTQGPYREFSNSILKDNTLFDSAATGGDLLFFSAKDVPTYVSKVSPAYKIYRNAKSAGVGQSTLKYLTEKTGKIIYNTLDKASQLTTGKSIIDHVESKIVSPKKTKL